MVFETRCGLNLDQVTAVVSQQKFKYPLTETRTGYQYIADRFIFQISGKCHTNSISLNNVFPSFWLDLKDRFEVTYLIFSDPELYVFRLNA